MNTRLGGLILAALLAACGGVAPSPTAVPTPAPTPVPSAAPATATATAVPPTTLPPPTVEPTAAPSATPAPTAAIHWISNVNFFTEYDAWRSKNKATSTGAALRKETEAMLQSAFAATPDLTVPYLGGLGALVTYLITEHNLADEFSAIDGKTGGRPWMYACIALAQQLVALNNAGLASALMLAFKTEALCEKTGAAQVWGNETLRADINNWLTPFRDMPHG